MSDFHFCSFLTLPNFSPFSRNWGFFISGRLAERQPLRWIAGLMVLFVIGLSTAPYAQSAGGADKVFDADTVKVVGHSPLLSELDLPTEITRIDPAKNPRDAFISEALSRQNGVFIKGYGGGEGTATISLRGMGAEHTLMMLNGVPLNNLQLGVVNTRSYGINSFSQVEIYRGGHSSLFGNGAVGGVVNMLVLPPEGHQYALGSALGAYGHREMSLQAGLPLGGTFQRFSYQTVSSTNEYDFSLDGVDYRRRNSDYASTQFDYSGWYPFSPSHSFSWQVFHTRHSGGAPRAVNAVADFQGRARIDDAQLVLRLKWDGSYSGGRRISMQGYFRRDNMRYNDPDLVMNNQPLRSNHENEESGLALKLQQRLSGGLQAFLGIEGSHGGAESSDLSGIPGRDRLSGFGVLELVRPLSPEMGFALQGALRNEYYSDYGNVFLPKIGGKLYYSNWQLYVSAGENYRAPTFNDLYWQPGGNPDLSPESSVSLEAGISGTWQFLGRWSPRLSVYQISLDKMIRWVPGSNGVWQPQNLDAVQSRGIECSLDFTAANEALLASLHYKYGISKLTDSQASPELIGNRISHLPSTEIKGLLQGEFAGLQLGADWQFASFRYVTIANSSDQILPSYQLLNIFTSYSLAVSHYKFVLYGRWENLLAEEYQLITGYPLPLRMWKLGLRIQYN